MWSAVRSGATQVHSNLKISANPSRREAETSTVRRLLTTVYAEVTVPFCPLRGLVERTPGERAPRDSFCGVSRPGRNI
jgi:hypothetical protein